MDIPKTNQDLVVDNYGDFGFISFTRLKTIKVLETISFLIIWWDWVQYKK
jgi:hypothetical protein